MGKKKGGGAVEILKISESGINYDEVQRNIVQQALDMTDSNYSSSARLLGLSRARFRTLLKNLFPDRKIKRAKQGGERVKGNSM